MSDQDIQARHDAANARGETHYTDPESGYRVFTAYGLLQRGSCCGSGCRHCPYNHANVTTARRSALVKQPAWISARTVDASGDQAVDVLFWSGGKDSFLALRALQRRKLRQVVLLTSFDVHSRTIAHQEIDIAVVARQADHLGLPLIGVPLFAEREYVDQITRALDLVPNLSRLVFGDLHLQHIRSWREDAFEPVVRKHNAELYFPIWNIPYDQLLADLNASGVICEISAVTAAARGSIRVGERFDETLIAKLPAAVDIMGENGEFHSIAKVWEQPRSVN